MLSTEELLAFVLMLRAHLITPDEFFIAIRYNEDEDVEEAMRLLQEMAQ